MQSHTIFIGATRYAEYCAAGYQLLLSAGCRLIENKKSGPYSEKELIEIGGQLSGVICGCEVWDETTISAAPNLKVIVKFGVGYDNIDLEAAKRHHVQVANCPGLNAISVAEHTFALLFSCLREIPMLDRSTREGKWERKVYPDLFHANMGILGFGAVGQAIAARAQAFGVHLFAYDKFPDEKAAERLGVRLCPLDEVLRVSDILSVNLPALPETFHLINEEHIAEMKDGVVIVNTARGILADEQAVAAALCNGKIGAYGSDVYEHEPMRGQSPLASCWNTVLTPHLAGESRNSYARIGQATAEGVLAVLSGTPLAHRLA